MGVARQLAQSRSAAVVAECGAGKTLISLASIYVGANDKPFVALAMVPSHLTVKWARESLQTIPRLRAFLIDGLRESRSKTPNGIHEVRLRNGRIVREGLATTLTDLRLRKGYSNARARWNALCPQPAAFILSKETAKLVTSSCLCKNSEDVIAPIFIEAVEDGENDAVHALNVDETDHGPGSSPHLDKAALDDIGGSQGAPEVLGKVVKTEQLGQVLFQPLQHRRKSVSDQHRDECLAFVPG